MVTASHNPKWDNGYKVYWSNGAQIKSPVDKGIAASIMKNLKPWEGSWDLSTLDSSPLLKDPLAEVMVEYFKDMQVLNGSKLIEHVPKDKYPKFVYTAVHGVGLKYAEASFKSFDLPPFFPVEEQAHPDPEFSTVKYPNPEEGPDTLELSFKTADAKGATVVLANDPDADRFAVAEKQAATGKWRIFTGNQLGAMLGYWNWLVFKLHNEKVNPADCYMLHSTVSSRILQSIASKEGFKVEETLTGFKWMGNRADELMQEGKKVVFAFEEAIGFMCGTNVLDKDGVSAMGLGAQMIIYAYDKYGSLAGFLDFIFAEYGYHLTMNSYFLCYDQEVIKALFDRIRYSKGDQSLNPELSFPEKCGQYKIKGIRDLTVGFDSLMENNIPVSSCFILKTKKW